uniref:MIR domain-containing protein n=2 Tax=Meloidogyne TaxID=189290 RepID=A0A6V7X310_MELEN|nr:unnamed protein product [Meloidogyne enterolobii]
MRNFSMTLLFFLLSLLFLNFVSSEDGDDPITCGTVLKLQNAADNIRLHSHEIKYGSGSGQQSVTGMTHSDDVNSHWQILGPVNQHCKRGTPIKCDDIIRLMHLQTRCFLHSHDFEAPLSKGNNEISCFGKEGESTDTGDHYKVVCASDVWIEDEQVRFKHVETGNYLALSGQTYNRPISGQREVVGSPSAGYSAFWIAAEGVFVKN